MSQGLSFQNLTNQTVSVNLAYYDASCGNANQNFRKQGWWNISSMQTVQVWNVDLRTLNRYVYFEAEFGPDTPVWAGTGNAWTEITDNGFDQCFLDQTNCTRWVDFQELDLGGLLGLVVQLGPQGGIFTPLPIFPPPPHTDHSDHSDGGWGGSSS
jgi:hypothetical protein